MNRASPAQLRKALEVADLYAKNGILFVPMPVANEAEFKQRCDEADSQLDRMADEAGAPALPIPDEYYLQDSRSYVGNDMLFWGAQGCGYTTDLRKAQVYTKAEALAVHRDRETDIPWPKAYIDAKARPAVDMQHVSRLEALKGTGIELIKPRQPKRETYHCGGCGKFLAQRDYYGNCPHCDTDNRP